MDHKGQRVSKAFKQKSEQNEPLLHEVNNDYDYISSLLQPAPHGRQTGVFVAEAPYTLCSRGYS